MPSMPSFIHGSTVLSLLGIVQAGLAVDHRSSLMVHERNHALWLWLDFWKLQLRNVYKYDLEPSRRLCQLQ
jgi:hypothetical protein